MSTKLPVITANRLPTELGPADFNTRMQNTAAVLAGRGGPGLSLLTYQSRSNSWQIGRTTLNPDDAGMVVIDFNQIARGYVEWAAQRPVQSIFATLVSGADVSVADLPNPVQRGTGGSDGPAFTYQVIGAFLDTGSAFRFETSTKGGLDAVEKMAEETRNAALAKGEDMHPVVELSSGSYHHPDYGTTWFPVFRVIGYVTQATVDSGEISEADIITDIEPPEPKKKAPDNGRTKTANGKKRGAAL